NLHRGFLLVGIWFTDSGRQTTAQWPEPRAQSRSPRQRRQSGPAGFRFRNVRQGRRAAVSWAASGEDVQALLKAVGLKGRVALLVVVRVVRVEPIAAPVDVEIGDLGEFRRLDEKLPLRDEC